MYQFQFDAPRFHDFNILEKITQRIQIDPNDPSDLWFMEQHAELTPLKEKQTQIDREEEVMVKNKIMNYPKQQKLRNRNRQKKNIVDRNLLKRSKISTIKSSSQSFKASIPKCKDSLASKSQQLIRKNLKLPIRKMQKNQAILQTKSETFSNNGNKIKQNYRLHRPCPYPLKVQRQWQTDSNRSWYNLSEKSAQKASKSMQKRVLKKIKPKNRKLKPFKF